MIPNASTITGAKAALTLIHERAAKRTKHCHEKTLTQHEHKQCTALKAIIHYGIQRLPADAATITTARAAALTVSIQL